MAANENVLVDIPQLTYYTTKQDAKNSGKFVAKEAGKSLISTDEITRLGGMETGAQVNVIESITVDGTTQTITGKGVALDLSAYAKKTDVASALSYKGSVADFASLPSTDISTGDVYNIAAAGGTDANGTAVKAGDNVAYNGTGWDVLAGTTDLSGYVEKVAGKALSTNDFTNEDKAKLDSYSLATNTDIDGIFA